MNKQNYIEMVLPINTKQFKFNIAGREKRVAFNMAFIENDNYWGIAVETDDGNIMRSKIKQFPDEVIAMRFKLEEATYILETEITDREYKILCVVK